MNHIERMQKRRLERLHEFSQHGISVADENWAMSITFTATEAEKLLEKLRKLARLESRDTSIGKDDPKDV